MWHESRPDMKLCRPYLGMRGALQSAEHPLPFAEQSLIISSSGLKQGGDVRGVQV